MKLIDTMRSQSTKHFVRKPFYLLLALLVLCSHDLYLKMETYFLQPHQEATMSLYNGTFEKSENLITRDRMLDASVIAQGERIALDSAQWIDQDSTITQITFNTGESGTYVAGVSTKARNIELTAEKFNSYLEHDGVLDMLEKRTRDNSLDKDAVERYEKHVKAIYQVGDVKTDDWKMVLDYPIEFVPQANPYDKNNGEKLEVQLLLDGKPLVNQLVFADYIASSHAHEHNGHSHDHPHTDREHNHGEDSDNEEGHSHTSGQQLRTNDDGKVMVDLPEGGVYYLRTIHMAEASDSDELTHRSKWATLTFEVGHDHDEHTHTHGGVTHSHGHRQGIHIWVYVLGGLLIVGLLVFVFRKKG